MCGIAGFIDVRPDAGADDLRSVVGDMADNIRHRGPDSCGVWVDESVGIALGHRRLAILDLSPTGDQPMLSEDGRYVITFNGEIYNHRTLREELRLLGCRFRGTSDTEVMLAAFGEWGVAPSLGKFVGMFAFGLWDRSERALYLVRDRMGEKPLYYGWAGSAFLFGSELKALRAHPKWRGEIDRDVLSLYFRHNYVPAPYCIYGGIRKLMPGTMLRVAVDGLMPGSLPPPTPYWSLRAVAEAGARDPFRGSDGEAIDRVEELLRTAVAGQMIADVPLGVFLSGGIDSSTVVALMQAQSPRPIRTFSIGIHDIVSNEAEFAKAVARHLGTEHTEFYVTPKEVMEGIPRLPSLYDEPFADSSQIPTYLVSQLARRDVTVCLTGDGGDEVFCGYNRHVMLNSIWQKARRVPLPLRKGLASLVRAIPASWSEKVLRRGKPGILTEQLQKFATILAYSDPESMYLHLTDIWNRPTELVLGSREPPTLLSDRGKWPAFVNFMDLLMYLEASTSLPDDMLVKVDRAAMGVSLETRVPYLDHRLLEFSWRLPLHMKLRDGAGKWILRQVLYRHVPRSLVDHPKSGFGIPIDIWLKGPLRDWVEEMLDEGKLLRSGFLDPNPVRERWREHLEGRRKWQPQLWGVLMFQSWLEAGNG